MKCKSDIGSWFSSVFPCECVNSALKLDMPHNSKPSPTHLALKLDIPHNSKPSPTHLALKLDMPHNSKPSPTHLAFKLDMPHNSKPSRTHLPRAPSVVILFTRPSTVTAKTLVHLTQNYWHFGSPYSVGLEGCCIALLSKTESN